MTDRSEERAQAKGALELPLMNLPTSHPCEKCGECCRYLAVEIDVPTTNRDYDHIFWYVAHKGVSVYIDWEGDWYIEFVTECEYLTDASTCGIYRERPFICSDFSWNDCERATGESASKAHFHDPDEFLTWLEKRRPKAWKKYSAYREKLANKRERKAKGEDAAETEAKAKTSEAQASA